MARSSNKQVFEDFNVRVGELLEKLGFEDVQVDMQFREGRQKIHAAGGFEDTLLIIECTTAKGNQTGLLDAIQAFKKKAEGIRVEVQSDPSYKRYSDLRFVLVSRYSITSAARQQATSGGGQEVHLWDDDLLTYYERLFDKVGLYAKFNLLGELGVKPRVNHIETFPCLRLPLNKKVLGYLFFAQPGRILRTAYVARRETGREHYYQRIVEGGKLNAIKKYVANGNYFPNSVILAFNVKPTFNGFPEVQNQFPLWSEGLEFGALSFPAEYRSCWIVDGQHRLYGLGKSGTSTPVPIVALENINVADQAQLFLDINKNQKPVPPELVWDLEGEMRPNEPDGIISRVAKELNVRGVLAERIYIPLQGPKKRGQLKLSGICAALAKQRLNRQLLRDNVGNFLYSDKPDDMVRKIAEAVQLALEELDKSFTAEQKNGFWLQNSGIAIFLAIFACILTSTPKEPKRPEFQKYLGALIPHFKEMDEIELGELRRRCSSETGRDGVVRELVMSVRKETGEEDFAGRSIPQSKFDKRIVAMERQLATLLSIILSKADPNWFKTRVPEGIHKKITSKPGYDISKPQDELTFGETMQIVKRKDNWLLIEKLALESGFSGQAEVEMADATINKLRAGIFHGRGKRSKHDDHLLEGYLGKFEILATSRI